MAATRHALWMLALPVLTACLSWYFCKRPPMFRRVLVAILVSLPVFFFPDHLCDAGRAAFQRFIGGLCVVAVISFATDRRAAAALGVVLLLASVGIISHYDHLVHGDNYTGRKADRRRNVNVRTMDRARESMTELKDLQDTRFPPGRVIDEPRLAGILPVDTEYRREVGEPLWHSSFTSLFRVRKEPVDLWHPGGTPAEGASGLQWRVRE